MSSTKRNITVAITEKIIKKAAEQGRTLGAMVNDALHAKGYQGATMSYVGDPTVTFLTKQGNPWTGTFPKSVQRKLVAASSFKARPYRYRPFTFELTIARA